MDNLLTKLQCRFIGWDYNILKECSAASRKTLRRYALAVMLIMLIWAYIGYNMADWCFKVENIFGKIAIALTFSFVVWIIEQQIILITGKRKLIIGFRLFLAAIMAGIGATIIDQNLFHADIKAHRDIEIEKITDSLATKKEATYHKEMFFYQDRLDSLEKKTRDLDYELSKNQSISLSSRQYIGADSMGVGRYVKNSQSILNPKYKELERISELIVEANDSISSLLIKQRKVRENAHKEAEESFGLLSELDLTYSKAVAFKSTTTTIFDLVVFGFFLTLELLVVIGKYISKECDYEVLVEQQQERKVRQIKSIFPINEDN